MTTDRIDSRRVSLVAHQQPAPEMDALRTGFRIEDASGHAVPMQSSSMFDWAQQCAVAMVVLFAVSAIVYYEGTHFS